MYNSQLTQVVTLTPAQIKSLKASPTLLVAGKAGQIINLLSCFLLFNPGGTPFGTLVAGDAITPVLGTGASALFSGNGTLATGFIDQTVPMGIWMDPSLAQRFGSAVITPAALRGASLYLAQFRRASGFPNGTDWTTGNGTITVFVRYSFITA